MARIHGFRPVDTALQSEEVAAQSAPSPTEAAQSAPSARGPATPSKAPALADRNAVMSQLAMLPPEEPVALSKADALIEAGKVDPVAVEKDVDTLFNAMRGWGTNEKKVFNTLENKSADHRIAVQDKFAEKHGKEWVTLRAALKDELSGKDLDKALKLLDKDVPNQSRKEIMKDAGTSTAVMKGLRHFGTWFSFGIGSKDIPNDPPRIKGAEIKRDLLPNLKPGDIILCGNHGGLSHAMTYVGDGKMVHSMASEETGQTVLGRLGETFKEPFDSAKERDGTKTRKTGVLEEGVAEFFDRFERDTYVVLRSPQMTPENAEAAVAKARSLVGKDYDFDFRPGNDAYYCTEVVGAAYREALGEQAPRIGARPQKVPLLLDREAIVDPLDVFESPDLQVAVASKSVNDFWDTEKRAKRTK